MSYYNPSKSYRRELVKKLFDEDFDDSYISHLTAYSESWIRSLRLQYNSADGDILTLKKPGGSVSRLSAADFDKLRLILDKGSLQYGLEGDYWDRKRVKYVIEQEFNVFYDVEHISDILAKINYTRQKPVKKDFRQSAEKVETWVEETLPAIKKR